MASKVLEQLTPGLAIIGGAWAVYQAFNLASFIQLQLLHRSTLQRYKDSKDPSWALITGATDGIGKGFAQELCARGFNIILHGRNPQKLDTVKQALLKEHPTLQIRTLCIDAAKEASDPSAFTRAVAELQGLNLRILINNVGGSGGEVSFMPLHERTSDQVATFMDVNARFPTEITRALLPQLRSKPSALILNVGSITGTTGIPYLSVYSGCKGYNRSWSQSLSAEMKAEAVDVEVLCIMVATVATDYTPRKASVFVATARQMASGALGKVGCGRQVAFGYWGHHVQASMLDLLPQWLVEKIIVDVGKKEKEEDEIRAKNRS